MGNIEREREWTSSGQWLLYVCWIVLLVKYQGHTFAVLVFDKM